MCLACEECLRILGRSDVTDFGLMTDVESFEYYVINK